MANERRLIDANALMKAIKSFRWFGVPNTLKLMFDYFRIIINDQPTVDAVEVVHGRWENFGEHRKMDLRCSVCNKRASNFVGGTEDWWDMWKPNYCPNCGAKMDGDGNGN